MVRRYNYLEKFMLKNFINKKNIKKYYSLVNDINAAYKKIESENTSKSIAEQLLELKNNNKLHSRKKTIQAMALAKKAAKDTLGLTYYNVQLMGALALVDGNMAEMKTGEGKTLTCSAAVAANFVLGFQTHVATANEYLAKRDCETLTRLYSHMGLLSHYNVAGLSSEQKKQAYKADVLYSTAQELGFDFLRDNLLINTSERVQPLNFNLVKSIIDEADFILIDEARTPLIISGESPHQNEQTYHILKDITRHLRKIDGLPDYSRFEARNEDGDFWLDEKQKNVYFSEMGYEQLEKMAIEHKLIKEEPQHNYNLLYDDRNAWIINEALNALRAQHLYQRDKDYIVRDGQIIIIDQNTGRLSEGRTWSNGLHQAIEAKENLHINSENMTLGSISIQNYFKIYHQISGMSGTIMQSSEEFEQIYNCKTIAIPTNKPVVRKEHQDKIYLNTKTKYSEILKDIKERHEREQPILIGTVSVAESEIISQLLESEKIPHQVLNAKNNALEAQIISQAGKPKAVTVATSMAGRGTDIILGGNKENILEILSQQEQYIKERITLAELITQQLQLNLEIKINFEEVSEHIETFKTQLEINDLYNHDEFAKQIETDPVTTWNKLFNLKNKVEKQKEIVESQWQSWREKVIQAGGLCVIGSSRNESRRIDDQLRGRAGRQGDTGESIFYMSVQDPWVQVFGNSPLFSHLTRSLPEDQLISSPTISKIFAKAQRSIESQHFDMRKNVFQYDSIADEGRKKFLDLRNNLISDNEYFKEITKTKLEQDLSIINNDDFLLFIEDKLNLPNTPHVKDILNYSIKEIYNFIDKYTHSENYEYYSSKNFEVTEEISKKVEEIMLEKNDYLWEELKLNLLNHLDTSWTYHLAFIDDAQRNVGFSSLAQKNPIYEYKKICFGSFSNMINDFKAKLILEFINQDNSVNSYFNNEEKEISIVA